MPSRSRPSALKYSGGALFRHFRRNHHLTQRQLALALSITKRHVIYVEMGKKFPSAKLMARFKQLLAAYEREKRQPQNTVSWRIENDD